MSPPNRPPKALIAAMLAPFGVALAFLVCEMLGSPLFDYFDFHGAPFSLFSVPLLLVILPIALAQGHREGRGIGAHARRLAVLSPCLLAPLSVLYPWVAAPGNFGLALGGFKYFLHWLTKYPNWGPINYEVLLGILCVLGASSIPVAFALYHVLARPPRIAILGLLLALDLVAFVPLMIRLDIGLIQAAFAFHLAPGQDFVDFQEGGLTESSILINKPSRCLFLAFSFGPLLRMLPVFVMTALVVLSLLRRAPAAPPPAGDDTDPGA